MKKHSGKKFGGRKATTEALRRMMEGPEGVELRRFAVSLCGNVAEADELVQEGCYRAMRAGATFDDTRPMRAWVKALIRNAFIDRRRRLDWLTLSLDAVVVGENGEPARLSEVMADKAPAIEEELARREEAAAVRRELATLAADHRMVIRLCDMAGLSYEEAARRLGLPLGTLKSRLVRARRALRRALGGAR